MLKLSNGTKSQIYNVKPELKYNKEQMLMRIRQASIMPNRMLPAVISALHFPNQVQAMF